MLKQINRLLNVQNNEWSRISLSWALGLLIRASYVIIWTLIMAIFISRKGIESLAVLFIANAIGIIFGTVIYSELLKKFEDKKVAIVTSLLAATTFFSAYYISSSSHETIFLALILVALSIFLTQLFILINLFIEELFSPLESQRTFPIIESYETIGGILGGFIIGSLAYKVNIDIFVLLTTIALLLMAVLIHIANSKIHKIPVLEFHQKKSKEHRNLRIKDTLNKIKTVPFARSMAIIVLTQFILFTIVEFQFAKAISYEIKKDNPYSQELSNDKKIDFIPEHLTASLINAKSIKEDKQIEEHTQEEEITHLLGLIVMIASITALITQLFISSRILSKFGIIKSMLTHPFVACLNAILLIWKFGFMSGTSLKISFEITNSIFNNGYHCSYYCIEEKDRSQIKEFMDGIMKPFGIIAATLILIFAHVYSFYLTENQIIHISLITFSVLMFLYLLKARKEYTEMSLQNLEKENVDLLTKENSVEILAQKGHRDISDELIRKLKSENIEEQLKIKIINVISQIGLRNTIPAVLNCLQSDCKNIKLAAINGLSNYGQNCNLFLDKAFTKYQIVKNLKELFEKETCDEIRTAILSTLVSLHEKEVIEFIINILQSPSNDKMLANTIEICRAFEDECLANYLEKYLNDANLKVRSSAMIALWKFSKYKNEIKTKLNEMLSSQSKEKLITAFHVSGEIESIDKIDFLKFFLDSNDLEIRRHAAIALAKMECSEAIAHLSKLILHENKEIALKTKEIVENLKPHIQKLIKNNLYLEISRKINRLLKGHSHKNILDLPKHILLTIKHYYEVAGHIHEALSINIMIEGK